MHRRDAGGAKKPVSDNALQRMLLLYNFKRQK
jgi:hypothetical protein